jgi:D-alanine-D-alanine ligase
MHAHPLALAILFDEPRDVPNRSDGTDSTFEMMSHASVSTIQEALLQFGFNRINVISTTQLLSSLPGGFPDDVDFVFNLSSGIVDAWRYAQGPMALDILKIPYSGSNPFTILLCRDKHRSKQLCSTIVRTPRGGLIQKDELNRILDFRSDIFPCIIKPNQEGGSTGITNNVARDGRLAVERAADVLADFPEGILIEEFIEGTEITSIVLGNRGARQVIPLALADDKGHLLPPEFYRTQAEKADAFETGRRTWFEVSDLFNIDIAGHIEKVSVTICDELDLRDIARLDFRLRKNGELFFLEINAQPTFVKGNTSLHRANEIVYKKPLAVECEFIQAALGRNGMLRSDMAKRQKNWTAD